MKKIYAFTLGLVGMVGTLSAQSLLTPQSDNQNLTSDENFTRTTDASRGMQVCSDTNLWAWARSFNGGAPSYFVAYLHNSPFVPNSYGTYVDVPAGTSINVSGFDLYARSIRGDGASVSVTAAIYLSGADSLPTGAPIRTATISLDTNTTNIIQDFEVSAMFATPATVNGSFIITIENSSTAGDSIEIIRGYTGSGVADGFPAVYQADSIANGDYFRDNGGSFGARLPHFYPYVIFNQTNSFMMSVSQLTSANEDVDFTHIGYSAQNHPIWSFDGFVGNPTTFWSIDGGANFTVASTNDTMITFVDETQDYTIVLHDSLGMWNGSTCLMSETQTLLGATPNGIEDIQNNTMTAFVRNGNLVVNNAQGKAELFSVTGRLVKTTILNANQSTINVNDLTEGVYILRVGNQVAKLKL